MKKMIVLIMFFCISICAKSQTWSEVPGYQSSYGIVIGITKHQGYLWVLTQTGIYKVLGSVWAQTTPGLAIYQFQGCMYSDGTDLYAGGEFQLPGSIAVILKWDGSQWNPLAYTESSGGGPVVTILKKESKIYAGGFFQRIGTAGDIKSLGYWAVFDGTTWSQPFSLSMTGCSYGIESIESIGDSIYVAGGFYQVDGSACTATFRFKDAGKSCLDNYGFCFTARDYQKYQGVLYAGGTRRSDNALVDLGLSKWNGNTWITVSDELGNTKSKIAVLLGKMYIAGRLAGSSTGGYITLISSYNGFTVQNVGIGISTPPNPYYYTPETRVLFADTIENKLYIAADIYKSKGDVADNIAVMNFDILPVHLTAFSAKLVSGNQIQLAWRDETPDDRSAYAVEMSTDGTHFSTVGTVAGRQGIREYAFVYKPTGCGPQYFRLAFEGKYSDRVVVKVPCSKTSIVQSGSSLRVSAVQAGKMRILNGVGQTVASYAVPAGASAYPTNALAKGIYYVQFQGTSGESVFQKIVVH